MKNKIIKLIAIISILLIIIDQLSKVCITNFLKSPIGNDYFEIKIVRNTGMALGFNDGNLKNIFITVFILSIVIVFIKNQIERLDKKTAIAISMIFGGAISNLIDRIFRGSVLDFIKIFNSYVFNFADLFIVIGWILLIIFIIDFSRK